VKFDYSGQYLAAIGKGVEIYANKIWNKIAEYPIEDCKAFEFLENANGFVASSGSVCKFYTKP
jgi:hypothetical protein